MSADETFANISKHQLVGIMFHHDLSDYFRFLRLDGYSELHLLHFHEETLSYESVREFYFNTHNKLLPHDLQKEDRVQVIPSSWMNHSRFDVNQNDRLAGIRNGFQMWVDWETKTKRLYSDSYRSLLDEEPCSAIFMSRLVEDVTDELSCAMKWQLELAAISYDMPTIMSCQEEIHKECEKDIRRLFKEKKWKQ